MVKRYFTPLLFIFGLILGSVCTGVALAAYQPHMHNALQALYTAKSELQAAASNKAGHRVNALNYVASAISEVKAGMASANGY